MLPIDPRLPAAARDAVLAAARPDEPVAEGDALVVASSGTTGEPKAVVLTHEAVTASALASSTALGVDPDRDRWLACLPLAHVGGLSVVTRALRTGTPLTVHPGFDAAAVEQAAGDGCTLTSLVPTALARIDPSRFRAILVGGQAPPPERPPNVHRHLRHDRDGQRRRLRRACPSTASRCASSPMARSTLRAPMLLRCYRDGTDPKLPDGWFPTGDLGELLADGRLHVHGRRGDLIITGGENVWPTAVERALATHPDVAEVAVVGRPDPEWGQCVVALIVPLDTVSPPRLAELRDHVKQVLPAYAAPTVLEVVPTLPRTASGKIRRADLTG